MSEQTHAISPKHKHPFFFFLYTYVPGSGPIIFCTAELCVVGVVDMYVCICGSENRTKQQTNKTKQNKTKQETNPANQHATKQQQKQSNQTTIMTK